MRHYAEDFGIGRRHVSAGYRISEPDIIEFAQKYDPQYYHLDAEAARSSQFGGLISSGLQNIALCWKLAYETGLFDDAVIAGIGLDEIRWLKPVHAGDVVRVEFLLLNSRRSRTHPDGCISVFQYEMRNQRDDIVVSLKMTQILRCRQAGNSD